MAESQAQARNSVRFTSAVARGLRESALIAIGVVALVLFVALVTYSPEDPGFSSFEGIPKTVHNQIGWIGAWLADALFFVFGRPAFLFPVVLGASCWVLLRRMRGEPGSGSHANTAVRVCGFLLVLFASCGLTTLHWSPGVLRESAGGIVGKEIGENLANGLGFLGATLLMLAAWMAGLSLAFHVSWLTVIDRLGGWAWAGSNSAQSRRSWGS